MEHPHHPRGFVSGFFTRPTAARLARAALVATLAGNLPAQVVNDGATNTLINATNNVGAVNVVIGTNGSFTGYILTNNALLTNTGNGTLGLNAGANSNYVFLQGTNARWNLTGSLTIGNSGSFNQLIVSNGSRLASGATTIGLNAGADNNRVIITGSNSTWVGSQYLVVGQASSFNSLLIANGATVSHGQDGFGVSAYLGGPGANFNTVTVTGTNTRWTNSGSLIVGETGSGNRLVISNGAAVRNTDAHLGAVSTSSNNVAVVTGLGSLWTNSGSLFVGFSGSGNQLVVSNGGTVANAFGNLGYNSTASNNVAVVTGLGSLWTNSSDLYVGGNGSGNRLVVSNGGVVASGAGFLGYNPGANNNVAVVTGPGSLWTNRLDLYVGLIGSGNQLIVSNGGTASATNVTAGFVASSLNNRVTVDGGTLLAVNSAGTGTLDIRRGTNVLNAGLIVADRLLLTNTAGVFQFNGGTLITRGGTINNGQDFVVGANAGFTNATWDVRSNAAPTTVAGSLFIGSNAANARLLITNGGVLANGNGILGFNSNANNNVAVVMGTNSLWTNSLDLYVGFFGSGNQLVVSNGGTVANGYANVGYNSGANNVAVTGAGSLWSNSGELRIGDFGSGNQLVVSNGAVVRNTSGYLGFNSGAGNNVAVVTGAGARWTNSLELYVGFFGSGNQLVVSNGGNVASGTSFIGYFVGASNNSATVTGGGSAWNLSGDLVVGQSGSFNRLLITNGGRVANVTGYLGGAGANGNVAVVTGTNSLWTNSASLLVGESSSGNQLVVSNGATVASTFGYLGYFSNANNNVALVTGAGSLWTNSSDLYVGRFGSGNQLVVSNDGVVANGDGFLGFNSSSSNNVAVVTGSGSLWSIANNFRVGESGSGNQLVVSNGGMVNNFAGTLGTFSTSSNNVAVVTGPGSLWTNGFALIVGQNGSGNQLVVSNGGVVANTVGILGNNAVANNNVALVTGAGSLWNNSSNLFVGGSGSGNQLVVSNGGVVRNAFGHLGFQSSSSNNVAVVTGAGSLWANGGELRVGGLGSGNQLVVSNGGTVSATNVIVGFNATSTNNRVTVDGGNLFATNTAGTGALNIRRGTNVLNAGLIMTDNLLLTNGAQSIFTFNSGTLNVRSATVNNTARFNVGNGTSNATYRLSGVVSDVHSFSNALVIASNATLTGNGTIVGIVTNFGTIAPGNSAGSLTINGNLRLQSSSMMSFELGGLLATNDYDVVNVTTFVQFAGTLSLSLLNNFLPDDSDSFTLLTFALSSGSFANISGGRVSLTNNLASFAVTQTATNLVLGGVTYTDTDGDGQGDLQELAAGTDPNNSASYLHITSITRDVLGRYVIQFQSVSGKSYRVEWKTSLGTGWSTISSPSLTEPVPGTSQWIDDGTLTAPLTNTTRFYQIGLQ